MFNQVEKSPQHSNYGPANTYISQKEFLALKTCQLYLPFSLSTIILSIGNTCNEKLLALMLRRGYDINTNEPNSDPLLFHLIGVGTPTYHHFLSTILKLGADPNIQNTSGRSALLEAVWFDDLEATKILLEHQANMLILNNNRQNIFDIASGGGATTEFFSLFVSQPHFDIFDYVGGETDSQAHSFFSSLRSSFPKNKKATDIVLNSFTHSHKAQRFHDALQHYCEYLQTENNRYYLKPYVDSVLYQLLEQVAVLKNVLKEKEMLEDSVLKHTPGYSSQNSLVEFVKQGDIKTKENQNVKIIEPQNKQKSLLIKI